MQDPVRQQPTKDKWTASFMMPASYTLETLPEPENPNVILRQIPGRWIATVRYTGLWRAIFIFIHFCSG